MGGKKGVLARRLGKARQLLFAATLGGLSITLAILLGNWLVIVVTVLLTAFKDEVRIVGRYISIVFLIVVCPGWSSDEKKQKIASQTEIFIQILGRDLVKKFLEREVL